LGFLDGQIGLNAAWQSAFATWLHHAKRHEFRQSMVEVESESQGTLKLFAPGPIEQLATTSGMVSDRISVASAGHDVAETQQTRAAA
jgi:hypothetical protein